MKGKLVRDRIPMIIKENGREPIIRIADFEEYKKALKEKLVEEAKELSESGNTEEIVDMLEVIYSLLKAEGMDRKTLEKMRKEKAKKRGSFNKRIILERANR